MLYLQSCPIKAIFTQACIMTKIDIINTINKHIFLIEIYHLLTQFCHQISLKIQHVDLIFSFIRLTHNGMLEKSHKLEYCPVEAYIEDIVYTQEKHKAFFYFVNFQVYNMSIPRHLCYIKFSIPSAYM